MGSQFYSVVLCVCFIPVPDCQKITTALSYSLKSGSAVSPALFFLRIALAIQGLSWFHISFRIFPFYEKCLQNFDRDLIKSTDGFGQYVHFNNINSSDPRLWNIFIYYAFFNFFHQYLQFSVYGVYRSFSSLLNLLTFFDSIINRIVFFLRYFIVNVQKCQLVFVC